MGTTLKNLKNKHLLAVIAVLCVGNVLACLALVFGEKRNAADIVVLRQQQAQDRDELARLSEHADERKQQQAQAILSAKKDLQASIGQIEVELRSHREYIVKLRERKWLTSGKREDMPWFTDLQKLSMGLTEAQKRLEGMQKYIAKLQEKKWLTSSKPEETPWFAELQKLNGRLTEAEKKLKLISTPEKNASKK